MEKPILLSFSTPRGEHFEPPSSEYPILTSGYDIPSGYLSKVQKTPFSGLGSENPYIICGSSGKCVHALLL
jgi:hypothetical protein